MHTNTIVTQSNDNPTAQPTSITQWKHQDDKTPRARQETSRETSETSSRRTGACVDDTAQEGATRTYKSSTGITPRYAEHSRLSTTRWREKLQKLNRRDNSAWQLQISLRKWGRVTAGVYYDKDKVEAFADTLERGGRHNQHEDEEMIHQEEGERSVSTLDRLETVPVTPHPMSADNISSIKKAPGSVKITKRINELPRKDVVGITTSQIGGITRR